MVREGEGRRRYSPDRPPFWNAGSTNLPAPKEPASPPIAALADLAPAVLRPFARGIALGFGAPGSGLGLGVTLLLVALATVFAIDEIVETRRDWLTGTAAAEQSKLFIAQSEVAFQEEMSTFVAQEASFIDAIKEGQGSLTGDPLLEAARPHMTRYRMLYDKAHAELRNCTVGEACTDLEKRRLGGWINVYCSVFYSMRARLRRFQEEADPVAAHSAPRLCPCERVRRDSRYILRTKGHG